MTTKSENFSHQGQEVTVCETKREALIPSDGQCVADDPLTATRVLDVHCDGRRVGHVSEATLLKQTGMKREMF